MTRNKEGFSSPNSAILSMTGTEQDVLKDVNIPAPVTFIGDAIQEISKPKTLVARMRSAPEESVRSEESQSEKVLTPVREQGESIPLFTPLREPSTGPMPATPGSFLDTMQSQAFGAPPKSMCTGFRSMEDTTEVSDFSYTGVTPL